MLGYPRIQVQHYSSEISFKIMYLVTHEKSISKNEEIQYNIIKPNYAVKETLSWHWQRTQCMEFESKHFHQRKAGLYFVYESHILRSVSNTDTWVQHRYGSNKEIQRDKTTEPMLAVCELKVY